jgi:DNA-binding beta-propeller fold protein YncE
VDPTASFAFVTDWVNYSGSLRVESIAQNGALTQVEQIREDSPNTVVVDPTGAFAYVVNGSTNTVSGYTIGSTGKLKPVPDSPFATGSMPFGVVVDRTGTFVYVTNFGANSVSGYRIRSTGALSPLSGSPFPTGKHPYRLTITP